MKTLNHPPTCYPSIPHQCNNTFWVQKERQCANIKYQCTKPQNSTHQSPTHLEAVPPLLDAAAAPETVARSIGPAVPACPPACLHGWGIGGLFGRWPPAQHKHNKHHRHILFEIDFIWELRGTLRLLCRWPQHKHKNHHQHIWLDFIICFDSYNLKEGDYTS